jgi:flagellar M-ring protein FliF
MELVETESNMPMPVKGFMELPIVRQMALMVSTAASIALLAVIVLWSMKPGYGVLFANMESREASEVMNVLQTMQVDFKLDENTGALLVPANMVREMRLKLAGEGFPRSSGRGLDILNQDPKFGTSQFLEVTRYQHALEAELVQSIMTISNVESARVHLALPKQSVFVRQRQKATASVLLNLYAGRAIDESQVLAISHMVASSIPNLEPEQVTIINEKGQLLSKKNRGSQLGVSEDQQQFIRSLEEGYIDRIVDLLSPVVGSERVRAQVTADVDFTVTESTVESFNPDLPALRSEQVSEESRTTAGASGVPGALANQPPGAGSAPEVARGSATAGGQPLNKSKHSTANYELDRTISHTRNPVGQIKRLSIAVVVDNKQVVGDGGKVTREPRTAEDIAQITSLVRDAVGYSAQRGDIVNVINAQFEIAQVEEVVVASQNIWEESWFMDAVKMGLGAIAVILFIFMVIRPTLKNLSTSSGQQMMLAGVGSGGMPAISNSAPEQVMGDDGELIHIPKAGAYEENLKMVSKVVKDDPALVAQVVRSWLNE